LCFVKVRVRVKVTVDAHFDKGPLESVRSRVSRMENEVARNETDVVQGGLVDGAGILVEAVRKTIDMRGDIGLSREHTLVQKLLLEL
jgi:hypothetical protein